MSKIKQYAYPNHGSNNDIFFAPGYTHVGKCTAGNHQLYLGLPN